MIVGGQGPKGSDGAAGAAGAAGANGLDGVLMPGLRLSLTTGVPVTTADVVAGTTIYYTPFLSGYISLFISSVWTMKSTAEISLALSGLTSGKNYDVFAYWTGSVVALELSSAWTNDTTRADALSRQNGILVKSADTTRRLIGTIRATGATTTEDKESQRFVSNLYNRVARTMYVTDSTDLWSYVTPSSIWRQANALTANKVECVLCDVSIFVEMAIICSALVGALATGVAVGLGIDSTTVNSAKIFGQTNLGTRVPIMSRYVGYPGLGYHALNWLETSADTGTNCVFYGDGGTTVINSGLFGTIEC